MTFLPHFPREPESELDWFEALIALARYLRTPEGCPWDREQTARDFARYLHEESQELQDAFAANDAPAIEEEFGDAFFNMLATAAAAEEAGLFRLQGALKRIHEKMIRRHGHVFGPEKALTPGDAVRMWNKVKEAEKAQGTRPGEE